MKSTFGYKEWLKTTSLNVMFVKLYYSTDESSIISAYSNKYLFVYLFEAAVKLLLDN